MKILPSRIRLLVIDGDFDLQLGEEMHGIFSAAIDFRMALLPAISLDFGHRHPVDIKRIERLTDVFQPRWFYYSNHQFHRVVLSLAL